MKRERAANGQQPVQPAIFALVEGDAFSRHLQTISEAIAHRAYELFERDGRRHGQDVENWYHAESQFLQPVPVEIRETSHSLTVRADIPGFTGKQVELRAWGHIVSLSAARTVFLTTEAETCDRLRSAAVSICGLKSNPAG
jgi:HSP20 family molecular chaperone IbpA